MQFRNLGLYSVKIVLSETDMEKYDISYERLDYADTHTKKIIWELLDRAKEETGFDTEGKKLHIQIYPRNAGGCELYISKLAENVRANGSVFLLEDFETAVSALAAIEKSGGLSGVKLYACGDKWYVSASDEGTLPEYGKKLSGGLWDCYLSEHGIKIGGEGIAEMLRRFLRK